MSMNVAPKYKNFSGMPLGGVGAGKIEICPDGAFRHLTIHNNVDTPITDIHNPFRPLPTFPVVDLESSPEMSPVGIESCFLAAYVEGASAMVLKEEEPGIDETLLKNGATFKGEVPIADMTYPPIDGVNISLHAFSSLILNEPKDAGNKDSSIPAIAFTLTAVNNGTRARRTSLMLTFPHIIGSGGYANAAAKDLRANFMEFREKKGIPHLHFGHRHPKMDPRLDGEYTLAVDAPDGADISYEGWHFKQVTGKQ